MDISILIKERRRALHLTQNALGKAVGYRGKRAERMVQQWEHNRAPIPLEKLRALAAALQIPLDTLIP